MPVTPLTIPARTKVNATTTKLTAEKFDIQTISKLAGLAHVGTRFRHGGAFCHKSDDPGRVSLPKPQKPAKTFVNPWFT
jgi:hypothetical protein